MFETDAWLYLNINHPFCAWETYRGFLISPAPRPEFVSVWTASIITSAMLEKEFNKLGLESVLELYRRQFFPQKVSRLQGIYCFLDQESAQRAHYKWGMGTNNHFQPQFLAEISLLGTEIQRDKLDSNWITYSTVEDLNWVHSYWSGEAYPDKEPLWETIVEGKVAVLGTDLRNRAYEVVKKRFPESLCLLEIARLAAIVGSDLGSMTAFHRQIGIDEVAIDYIMNMEDANNPEFLRRLEQLKKSGEPVNLGDMSPYFQNDSFGNNTPDLRPWSVRYSKSELGNIFNPVLN